MPKEYSLLIIGGIRLQDEDGQPVSISRKALALICYLKLGPRHGLSRDALAGLLWGDTSNENARASLRQTLSELRGLPPQLAELLHIERNFVNLDRELLKVDLEEMLNELEAGRVPPLFEAASHPLERILDGCEAVSPGFNAWIQEFRTSAEARITSLLHSRYEDRHATKELRQRCAEIALSLNPLDEVACRFLMQSAAKDGNIAEALRRYAKIYDLMDEELGMEPSAATQDLVVKIKQGEFDSRPTDKQRTSEAVYSNGASRTMGAEGLVSPGEPVIAVLPMRSIGSPVIADDLSEMLVDDIVCKLAQMNELSVISTNSTRQIAEGDVSPQKIREMFGANYAVMTKIGTLNQQLKLAVELVDTRSQIVKWAQSFEPTERDLLETQSRIAAEITMTLVPQVHLSELKMTSGYSLEDLDAYHLTLRARQILFDLDIRTFGNALNILKEAIEREPHFAQAHYAMADWYSLNVGQGWSKDPTHEVIALETSARKAARLDPVRGRALAMIAHNQAIYAREYDSALDLFDEAVKSMPNDAETLMWTSPTLAYVGEHDAAIDRAERALSLSPKDPLLFRYQHFLSIAHFASGNYEKAAHWGRASMKNNPFYTSNLRVTAASLLELGDLEKATKLGQLVLQAEPGFRVRDFIRRQAFKDQKRREDFGERLLKLGLPM